MALVRPWHRAWPSHVPPSIDYPVAPAWWLLERNVSRFAGRVAVRELDYETLDERHVLTYEALWRAVRGVAAGLPGCEASAPARGWDLPAQLAAT